MRNLSLKLTKALLGAFLLTGYGLAYAKAASFNAPLTTAHCLFIEQLELADLEGRKLPEFDWLREKLVTPMPDAIDGACLGPNDKDVLLSRAQQILIEKGFVTTRVLFNASKTNIDPLVLTIVPGRVRTIRFDNFGKVKTDLTLGFSYANRRTSQCARH